MILNKEIKIHTFAEIVSAVSKARFKHKIFANNNAQIVALAAEEFGEWAKEINDNNLTKARAEALDLIAVLVRYLEND